MELTRGPLYYALTVFSLLFVASAQTFLEAISQYPQLANFTTLMNNNPGLAGALLTSNATSLTKTTVLVPDNSAFDKLQKLLGVPVGSLSVAQLEPVLSYHLLVNELTTDNFTVANGTTQPTFLTGPLYNNRSAGAALGSSGAEGDPKNGQVVFIETKDEATLARRFTVRQLPQPGVEVQGGLGHIINMTAVDGSWDGGVFQIVDNFLDLPLNCTDTIRRWKMFGFSSSLTRTGLGAPLDITRNVTCLTPNDDAFKAAGSPNVTASIFDLQQLTLFHIIDQPLYSNFMADGQEYTTFSNQTVRITIRDGDIFVNDAKIIHANVMTNNGLMHVIDKVMSPLDKDSNSTATSTSSTASATDGASALPRPDAEPTESSSGAAATATASASPTAGSSSKLNLLSQASWALGFVGLVAGFFL